VDEATKAIDGLDKLQGRGKYEKKEGEEEVKVQVLEEEEADEEIISEGATKAEDVSAQGKREADIDRIRAKALMRRARARSEIGGWSTLSGAEEGMCISMGVTGVTRVMWRAFTKTIRLDYKVLSQMKNLSAGDMKIIRQQLIQLPPRTKAAQEKEMAEMMGKLKSLGNGILKPFGLSTDNFQMIKDEKTGGYSMNFSGGGGSK
jgi:hypothetical protein